MIVTSHSGPLAGIGILVTRPARQAGAFAQKIAALGALPVIFPAIVILPPEDPARLASTHAVLGSYDFAVFVSANAVEFGVPDARAWPPTVPAFRATRSSSLTGDRSPSPIEPAPADGRAAKPIRRAIAASGPLC